MVTFQVFYLSHLYMETTQTFLLMFLWWLVALGGMLPNGLVQNLGYQKCCLISYSLSASINILAYIFLESSSLLRKIWLT